MSEVTSRLRFRLFFHFGCGFLHLSVSRMQRWFGFVWISLLRWRLHLLVEPRSSFVLPIQIFIKWWNDSYFERLPLLHPLCIPEALRTKICCLQRSYIILHKASHWFEETFSSACSCKPRWFLQTQLAGHQVVIGRRFFDIDTNVRRDCNESAETIEKSMSDRRSKQSAVHTCAPGVISVLENSVRDAQCVVTAQLQQELFVVIYVIINMSANHPFHALTSFSPNVCIEVSQKNRGFVSFSPQQRVASLTPSHCRL